jgi:hypothetical protein
VIVNSRSSSPGQYRSGGTCKGLVAVYQPESVSGGVDNPYVMGPPDYVPSEDGDRILSPKRHVLK